jgi:hypothetical protein
MLEGRQLPSTFLVTNTHNDGAGSLRQAILDANANPGLDTIAFAIDSGLQTIAPATPLPDLTDPVVIDGTTQPGYQGTPLIELNGAPGNLRTGLTLTTGASTVRGLVINRFSAAGIRLTGAGGDVIAGNYLGTDAAGGSARRNGTGIDVEGGAGTVIGGTGAGDGNLLSGNLVGGLILSNATDARIEGNFIGTDAAGTAALPNTSGVVIDGGSGHRIGGSVPGARNLM